MNFFDKIYFLIKNNNLNNNNNNNIIGNEICLRQNEMIGFILFGRISNHTYDLIYFLDIKFQKKRNYDIALSIE